MGNKLSTSQIPVIMTKTYVEEKFVHDLAVVEGLNISELKRLVKMDGIESSLVLSLQFEHQRLLNIGNIWKFSLLTKLEIANNFIDEIEGLDSLSRLRHLDLSFNCIKVIEGLDGLKSLRYLNLSSNEISLLENMENLKKLETFLVRHNNIKSFGNVYYLAQFINLYCLGLGENPVMQEPNVRHHVIAVLPQLKFLDFLLVTEAELQEALFVHPTDRETDDSFMSRNKNINYQSTEDFSYLWDINVPDKEAFVEGLASGCGFQILLENDKNFCLLHSYPPASPVAENHRKDLGKLFDKWHAKGRSYYEQMQAEKGNFVRVILDVLNFTVSVSDEEEYSYVAFKEEIPKKLCLIYQKHIASEQKDQEVDKLKEKCYEKLHVTHRNLMNSLCMCFDLIFELVNTFEIEISSIIQKYLQDVHELFQEIMKIDELYILQLKEFYFRLFNTGSIYDMEVKDHTGKKIELDPIFKQLLTKKEFVDMALKMALTIHSALLQKKVKKLKISLENYKKDTLNSVLENDVLVKQNEQIRNIVAFSNKQKYIIDKFFANHITFKHYLGYN